MLARKAYKSYMYDKSHDLFFTYQIECSSTVKTVIFFSYTILMRMIQLSCGQNLHFSYRKEFMIFVKNFHFTLKQENIRMRKN